MHALVCASRYTGKERDPECGLNNFGARYDSSSMGRFMSPDPLYIEAHRLADPQRLNLYVYARNNQRNEEERHGEGNAREDRVPALMKN
jgi:RHS repeat-associated protein